MKLISAMLATALLVGSAARSSAAIDTGAPGPHAAATVKIVDFAFDPPTLRIVVGQSVTFTNNDGDAHTVNADDTSFASAGLDKNDSWSHTFTKPGTVRYFCALHPSMKATIVVLPVSG